MSVWKGFNLIKAMSSTVCLTLFARPGISQYKKIYIIYFCNAEVYYTVYTALMHRGKGKRW
jgi:hypothetical protein